MEQNPQQIQINPSNPQDALKVIETVIDRAQMTFAESKIVGACLQTLKNVITQEKTVEKK